mmetsp:Transcript_5839/g.10408  ORF Transcript_5839/g.10408 Transcript_5839/m.10408 type:complete len:840 (+) Transcript_5839:53-2572(+)
MDLKIFIRLRPPSNYSVISTSKDNHELLLEDPTGRSQHRFEFDNILLHSLSQEEVFLTVGRSLCDNLLDGFNGCLLGYGPTGSGKSFNVMGLEGPNTRGLLHRSMDYIFEETRRHKAHKEYNVKLCVFEIYLDKVRDLALGYKDTHAIQVYPTQNLEVYETNGEIVIPSLTSISIASMNDFENVLRQAFDLRQILETRQGKFAARVHTIVGITLSQRDKAADRTQTTANTLYIVDLAGADQRKKSEGKLFQDSVAINATLHTLSKVLSMIHSQSVPYKESKLTHVLHNNIGGNACTTLLISVQSDAEFYAQTLASLEYAESCKSGSQISVGVAEETDTNFKFDMRIKILQEEKVQLKEKLRKIEEVQGAQLFEIGRLFGIEGDLEVLLQPTPDAPEVKQVQATREAVGKLETLTKKNRELEKKRQEHNRMFDRIKRMEAQNQEKSSRKLLELKDELYRAREELQILKSRAENAMREQAALKQEELQSMLAHSHVLLEEKARIVKNLPAAMQVKTIDPRQGQIIRAQGRSEINAKYETWIQKQFTDNSRQIELLTQNFEGELAQKHRTLENMTRKFADSRKKHKESVHELRSELQALHKIYLQNMKVLKGIQSGAYNQKLREVVFPRDQIPEPIDEVEYPKLFKLLTRAPKAPEPQSMSASLNRSDASSTLTKQRIDFDNAVFQHVMTADIEAVRITELRSILGSLRDSYKNIEIETNELNSMTAKEVTSMGAIDDRIREVSQEMERYRELYQSEVKNHNEVLMQIETQKRIVDNQPAPNARQRLSSSTSSRVLVRPMTTASGKKGTHWSKTNRKPEEESKSIIMRGIHSAWGSRYNAGV